jgi:hypothetical protein
MRFTWIAVGFALLGMLAEPGRAQNRPGIHRLDAFMTQGAFTSLDLELVRHRLSLQEIESSHLDGKAADLTEILTAMARYEKLSSRVEEPLEVTGKISVSLPPNAMGDEAFTACFCAFTYNGLALSGIAHDLVLVRPEKHPKVALPVRAWNKDRILSAELYHLGFLNPDAVMRRYRDAIGTQEGHAILVARSNVLIVVDARPALGKLRDFIDSEVMQAMGSASSNDEMQAAGSRPPSLGAIATRAAIHFYLMAYARSKGIPLVASEKKGLYTRRYPEANLWTSERGYKTIQEERRRISGWNRLAQETGGLDWVAPDPARTLSPAEQKKLEIRFGVVSLLPGKAGAESGKKTSRRRRQLEKN